MPALLITGTVGTGKTVVAAEAGRRLEASGVPCGVVDLDWLGWLHAPGFSAYDELITRNLAAIWPHLREAGAERLVLARALTSRKLVDRLRRLPADLTVVRLTCSPGTIEARLRRRDAGEALREHLAEATRMARRLERLRLESAVVSSEGRPPAEVAADVLRAAGWTSGGPQWTVTAISGTSGVPEGRAASGR